MGRLILASFDDPVVARCAWAQHFEDDDGAVNDARGSIDGGTHDHAVGVADLTVRNLKLEVASIEATRLASEARAERRGEVGLDVCVTGRPADHRHGADAIEFVAQRLPLLPLEEFGERHGFA